jgi:hypothetical protein
VANFIFDWAAAALTAATLDLSTGNYYAHLVTTAPLLTHTTVADLVLPSISGYAPTALTGLSYNSTRWTFDSFTFPKYNFAAAPTGVVICKRTGSTPASTDGIICYSDFNNSIGQTISLSVGAYVVNLQFGSQGAINFSYLYQYNSGDYDATGGDVPSGLIHLIGTKNNTVSYTNPFNSTNATVQGNATDKTLPLFNNSVTHKAFDFGVNLIRPVTFGMYIHSAGTPTITLSASNNISGVFNQTNVDNNAFWTDIGVSTTVPSGQWVFFNVTNTTYWRYFRFSQTVATMFFGQIELYNSSALSPTADFV